MDKRTKLAFGALSVVVIFQMAKIRIIEQRLEIIREVVDASLDREMQDIYDKKFETIIDENDL